MRSKAIRWVVIPVVTLTVGIAGLIAMATRPEEQKRTRPAAAIPDVRVQPAATHRGSFGIEVDGVVAPFRDIVLSAEVSGRIVAKAPECNEGHFVRRGTTLLTIDPTDYELEVQRLTELLHQADADLQELEVNRSATEQLVKLAEEQYELARQEVGRLERLVGGKVVTDCELDREKRSALSVRNELLTLKREFQLLNTRYGKLRSGRELARIQLEKARLDLGRAKIVAPTDGVVVSDLVEQDSYVQKGTELVRIDDTSAVEVRCNLRMDELYWLWRGGGAGSGASGEERGGFELPRAPATIFYRFAGRESTRYVWRGVLDRYDGLGLDETTRTVPCRVVVDRPTEGRVLSEGDALAGVTDPADDSSSVSLGAGSGSPPSLLRGMFVTVVVHADPPASARLLVVPEQAVQANKTIRVARLDEKSGHYLCRIVRGVKLVQLLERPAVAGASSAWLVDAGDTSLREGDLVITSPLAVAADGMRVGIVGESAGGGAAN